MHSPITHSQRALMTTVMAQDSGPLSRKITSHNLFLHQEILKYLYLLANVFMLRPSGSGWPKSAVMGLG